VGGPLDDSSSLRDYNMVENVEIPSLVSKRTSFFGNTLCLPNFRELARARWSQQQVATNLTVYRVWYGWRCIEYLHSERN
jgi:hypothetical protein